MSEKVTIKTIAKDLGVSHMTVSRALSNHPNVHKKTRETILRRAKELGYARNVAATAMRGDRTGIVGLLLPNILNEFYARFANTMAVACEEAGYHLIIHLTNDEIGVEAQSLQRLREVQAEAVVMVPAPGDPENDAASLGAMTVIQLIRRRETDLPVSAILLDDHAAIRDAVIHLANTGRCELAYIGADAQLSSGRERLAAFRTGLKAAGLTEIPGLICTSAPTFEMGRASAQRVIDGAKATGIVCGGFEISNGALSAFMDRGIPINGSVILIGYGDPSFYRWIGGGLSTIGVPVERLAIEAVEILNQSRNVPAPPTPARSFDAELIVRG